MKVIRNKNLFSVWSSLRCICCLRIVTAIFTVVWQRYELCSVPSSSCPYNQFLSLQIYVVVVVDNRAVFAGEPNAKWNMMRFVESTVCKYGLSGQIFQRHCNLSEILTVYIRELVDYHFNYGGVPTHFWKFSAYIWTQQPISLAHTTLHNLLFHIPPIVCFAVHFRFIFKLKYYYLFCRGDSLNKVHVED